MSGRFAFLPGQHERRILPARIFIHTADAIKAAESNPNQFIDGVNPKDESSSEAAEKALGKVPNQPSQEDVQAVEEILKPRGTTEKRREASMRVQRRVNVCLLACACKCLRRPDVCAVSG